MIYVGRIDANKGCAELFDFFTRYASERTTPLSLVLIGKPVIDIPTHPRIKHARIRRRPGQVRRDCRCGRTHHAVVL